MQEIDMSTVNNLFEKSMLFFLSYIFESEYCPYEKDVDSFISCYLVESKGTSILPSAKQLKDGIKFKDAKIREYEEKIKKLKRAEWVAMCYESLVSLMDSFDINFEEIEKKFPKEELNYQENPIWILPANSGIYNICTIIMNFDKLEDKIEQYLQNIEYYYFEDACKLSLEIDYLVSTISLGISNFILDLHQDNILDMSQNYTINPDCISYLKSHRLLLNAAEVLLDKEHDYKERLIEKQEHPPFLFPVCMETILLKKKLDILKMMLPFICIIRSPEYKVLWKEYASVFLDAFRSLFFCGTIHKVQFQTAPLTGDEKERGSENATTRLQIVFSLLNDDIFILRLDMPHQGCEKIHFNIEETIEGGIISSGFPLTYDDERLQILKKLSKSVFDSLFYESGNRYWFKSNFEQKLSRLDIESELRDEISEIFEQQSHKSIDMEYDEYEMIEFLKEIQFYAERLQLTNLISKEFGKEENLFYQIRRIRKTSNILFCLRKHLTEFGLLSRVSIRDTLWELYSEDGLKEICNSREAIEELDFSKLWKLVGLKCM